jgi:branched-chain amino acid transport system permease protein
VGPIQAVDAGMGDSVVVLALVVIVVGGIGSVRGAFVAALLIGMLDTCARALLPQMMRAIIDGPTATLVAGLLAPVMVYLLMALVLLFQPRGLMGGKI